MMLEKFNKNQSAAVIRLFANVFSDSEGQEEGEVIRQLVTELITHTRSENLLGYLCIAEEKITGSIFFSRLTLPSGKRAFILSPVAVATQQQGNGVGQKLITFGLQQLKDLGVELVFTYGDPAFYSKVGFTHIDEAVVKAPRNLTYPEGWLAQSLTDERITEEAGAAMCVNAINKQAYW